MGIDESFTTRVERFLADTGMRPSRFGFLAVRDGNFIDDLRQGRSPRARTIDAVDAFMRGYKANRKAAAEPSEKPELKLRRPSRPRRSPKGSQEMDAAPPSGH